MPDLIAQGADFADRWRRRVPVDQSIVLGRNAGAWSVPWDACVSRKHAQLKFHDGLLHVRRLSRANNPIFVKGDIQDRFPLAPGEHFVIGQTTFTLVDDRARATTDAPDPTDERTFALDEIRHVHDRDAGRRLDVLSRLPQLIASANDEEELFVHVVNVLLTGSPDASAAAVAQLRQDEIEVLHWDRRDVAGGEFAPSAALIRRALSSNESVVHVWGAPQAEGETATLSEDVDWAVCTPLRAESCQGWVAYVTGKFPAGRQDAGELAGDVKFIELAAATMGSLRDNQLWSRRRAALRQFLPPVVLHTLSGRQPETALAPREADVAVMFCDLRGFSRKAEKGAEDLLGLLERVSGALSVMTRHILQFGGVVGDFHGDSAMGFWGWPLKQPDAVERAARAALAIRAEFASTGAQSSHPLHEFGLGIGLAAGRAVAGKIGADDQVKVSVFGPVVNLASRLEGMTKILQAPILLDRNCAAAVRQRMNPSEARVRRVAVVRPYGMDQDVEVNELLPPEPDFPQLTGEHLAAYEKAVDAVLTGDFAEAFQWLHRVPAEDRVKDFLTVFIAQHNRAAPAGWDGAIRLTTK